MLIRFSDFRPAGICDKAKQIFFIPNGLDWKDFVRNGIDSEKLRATGQHADAIDRLEAAARERINGIR